MVPTEPCHFVSAPLSIPFHWLWACPCGYTEEWASANVIYMESDSIFMSGNVILNDAPLNERPTCEAVSAAMWEEDYKTRHLDEPHEGSSGRLTKWNSLLRHASSWAFYMFRVIKETMDTWQRPMGAIKPLWLSPLFKKKKPCQLQIYSCSSAKANDRQKKTNQANLTAGRGIVLN